MLKSKEAIIVNGALGGQLCKAAAKGDLELLK